MTLKLDVEIEVETETEIGLPILLLPILLLVRPTVSLAGEDVERLSTLLAGEDDVENERSQRA